MSMAFPPGSFEPMYIDDKDYHFNWMTGEEEELLKEYMPCYESCPLCRGELRKILKKLKEQNDIQNKQKR